jgi:hypothetical protein
MNKCKKVASSKMDKKFSVFANRLWKMLLKAIGQLLGASKRVY